MLKKLTHLCSLFLVLALLVLTLPASAFAEITADEFGGFTFSSFADLQELTTKTYESHVDFEYVGSEPLVIESDISLPNNVVINVYEDIPVVIPSGVTVTAYNFSVNNLTIEGKLKCDYLSINGTNGHSFLTVTGSAEAINVYVWPHTVVNGLENIAFNESYLGSGVTIRYSGISTFDRLKEVVSKATADTREKIRYQITHTKSAAQISESLTIPKNCDFHVYADLVINEGCVLQVDGSLVLIGNDTICISGKGTLRFTDNLEWCPSGTASLILEEGCTFENYQTPHVYRPWIIRGTLLNYGRIFLDSDAANLTLAAGGHYGGQGGISMSVEYEDQYAFLPGFNPEELSVSKYAINDNWWDVIYTGSGLMDSCFDTPPTEPTPTEPTPTEPTPTEPAPTEPAPTEPAPTEPAPTEPILPTLTGTYTTDITMPAADLGVNAEDARLRCTLTFNEDGTCSAAWEAISLEAFRVFYHDLFVNAYYACGYGAGITDIAEIEQFCMDSTGMNVSDYIYSFLDGFDINALFTPAPTSGTYSYSEDHTAIFTDLNFMGNPSDPAAANAFTVEGNTLNLNAASWNQPDYTFVCTKK